MLSNGPRPQNPFPVGLTVFNGGIAGLLGSFIVFFVFNIASIFVTRIIHPQPSVPLGVLIALSEALMGAVAFGWLSLPLGIASAFAIVTTARVLPSSAPVVVGSLSALLAGAASYFAVALVPGRWEFSPVYISAVTAGFTWLGGVFFTRRTRLALPDGA
jgi:hypothetical protein